MFAASHIKRNLAAAAFTAVATSGCAVLPPSVGSTGKCMETTSVYVLVAGGSKTTFNEKCAEQEAARELVKSPDPATQAVGLGVLRQAHPKIDHTANQAADLYGGIPLRCKVEKITSAGNTGNAKVSYSCVPATEKPPAP